MIGSVAGLLTLAAGASMAAFALAGIDMRYALTLLAAVAAGDFLLYLGSWSRVQFALVASLATGLSVGPGITFFLHTSVSESYLPFVGGAEGVTLSLALLSALTYAGARALSPAAPLLQINWAIVVPQILFMAAGLVSLLAARFPALTLLEEQRQLGLLFICIVVMNLTAAEMATYQRALAWTVILQATLVGLQWSVGRPLGLSLLGEGALLDQTTAVGQVARPGGTFGDPNIAAYFFEITGPTALLLALSLRRPSDRLLQAAAAMAAFFGALVTLSRGAWIALPLCSLLALMCFLGRRALQTRIALRLGGVALLAAIAAMAAWPFLSERLFGEDGGSTEHRIPLLKATWQVLMSHGLIGIGLNNFAPTFETADPSGYFRIFSGVNHVVHNLHLLVWTEVGTLGFAAYLSLFAMGWVTAYRLRNGQAAERALAFGVGFGLLAHFLHGFVDPGFKLSLLISQLVVAQFGVLAWLQLHHAARS